MKISFLICVLFAGCFQLAACESVLDVLIQLVTVPATDSSIEPPLFPKILNPLHWIPKTNIPWNPDSDLTTVSIFMMNSMYF